MLSNVEGTELLPLALEIVKVLKVNNSVLFREHVEKRL